MANSRFRHLLLLICLGLFGAMTHAADEAPNIPAETVIQPDLQQQLEQLLENAERKQRALDTLGRQRATLAAGVPSTALDSEIEDTQKKLNDLREQFLQLATNNFSFTLNTPTQVPQFDINWQQDLIQVIHPLLREMKELTERPRARERISGEMAFYRDRAADLDKAAAHLQQLRAGIGDQRLARALQTLENKINEQQGEIDQKLAILQRQLEEQREQPSQLWLSIAEGARTFAVNIGLYLLLALSLSIAVYYSIRLLGKLIRKLIVERYNERLIFVERAVNLLMQTLSILLGVLVFLMVLYAVDAWVLLGLFLIIGLGVLLSFRGMVPTYVMELRTLLNLGSVRQNERLIFNNLPWRVASLDVYTLLHNPALNGFFRVPLTQISKLSSRPFQTDEPWFPCDSGDYVALLDGMFGRVVLQSPEVVQLNVGESIVSYRTEAFLNQRPQNLSRNGFTVGTDFGVDYRHQAEVTTTVVDTLRYDLEAELERADFGALRRSCGVELKAASASSLDFRLWITFDGKAAENYSGMQRWLQRFAVDCANRNGWEIPFQQITVHYADAAPQPQPDGTPKEQR